MYLKAACPSFWDACMLGYWVSQRTFRVEKDYLLGRLEAPIQLPPEPAKSSTYFGHSWGGFAAGEAFLPRDHEDHEIQKTASGLTAT